MSNPCYSDSTMGKNMSKSPSAILAKAIMSEKAPDSEIKAAATNSEIKALETFELPFKKPSAKLTEQLQAISGVVNVSYESRILAILYQGKDTEILPQIVKVLENA